MEQQDTDGLPAHLRNQLAFDSFFDHQTHRPSGTALGWVATDHRDDPLLLAVFEQRRGSGPFLLIKRTFQAALLITMRDLTNRLRCKRHNLRYLRRAHTLAQLQQRQSSKDDPNLLDAAAENLSVPSGLLL